MSNTYNLAVDTTVIEAAIATVDTVVDAIRAVDVTVLAAQNTAIGTVVDEIRAVDVAAILVDTNALKQELDQRVVSHAVDARTNVVAWANVVNINDQGVLTGIAQSFDERVDQDEVSAFEITIDGVLILSSVTGFASVDVAKGASNNSISLNHRFDTSLQVRHMVALAAALVTTTVSYTTD